MKNKYAELNKKRKRQWDKYWKKFSSDNVKIATCKLSAMHTVDMLGFIRSGKLLDLGCGVSDIPILLAKQTKFKIFAVDFSNVAVKLMKNMVKQSGLKNRIVVEMQNAFDLSYDDNEFDVLVSFGHSSVASYIGVTEEVKRVVKPNGVIIMDFTNHLSLYDLLYTFDKKRQRILPSSLRILFKYLKIIEDKESYHFGVFGIKKYFEGFGLKLENLRFFNTYASIFPNRFSSEYYLYFENNVGRLLAPILGRVIIAKFRNVK